MSLYSHKHMVDVACTLGMQTGSAFGASGVSSVACGKEYTSGLGAKKPAKVASSRREESWDDWGEGW